MEINVTKLHEILLKTPNTLDIPQEFYDKEYPLLLRKSKEELDKVLQEEYSIFHEKFLKQAYRKNIAANILEDPNNNKRN